MWIHLDPSVVVSNIVHREKDGGTEVALRVAYLLPEQLREFVGPVGVWGDVNDILQENLDDMKVSKMLLRARQRLSGLSCPTCGDIIHTAIWLSHVVPQTCSTGSLSTVSWRAGFCGG